MHFLNEIGKFFLVVLLRPIFRFKLLLFLFGVTINHPVQILQVKVAFRGLTCAPIVALHLLLIGVLAFLDLLESSCQLLHCEVLAPILLGAGAIILLFPLDRARLVGRLYLLSALKGFESAWVTRRMRLWLLHPFTFNHFKSELVHVLHLKTVSWRFWDVQLCWARFWDHRTIFLLKLFLGFLSLLIDVSGSLNYHSYEGLNLNYAFCYKLFLGRGTFNWFYRRFFFLNYF